MSQTERKFDPELFKHGNLEILGFEKRTSCSRPLYLATVMAGFPSPADDFIDKTLDLNEFLISHPEATFFVRVYGDSMRDAGLSTGDILVVDRALEPVHNRIVIAALNGELTGQTHPEAGHAALPRARAPGLRRHRGHRGGQFSSLGRGDIRHSQGLSRIRTPATAPQRTYKLWKVSP